MVTIYPILFYTLWGYLNNITKYPNCQAFSYVVFRMSYIVCRISYFVKKIVIGAIRQRETVMVNCDK